MTNFFMIDGGRFVNVGNVSSFEISRKKAGSAFIHTVALRYKDGTSEEGACSHNLLNELARPNYSVLPAQNGYKVYFLDGNAKLVDPEGWDVLAFAIDATPDASDPPIPVTLLGMPPIDQPWCVSKDGKQFFDSCGAIWNSLDAWANEYKEDK